MNRLLFSAAILLVIFSVVLFQGARDYILSVNSTVNMCLPAERKAKVCVMVYEPVCGVLPSGEKQTFSNSCVACSRGALYWKDGACNGAKAAT